jgi:hypothetical protein
MHNAKKCVVGVITQPGVFLGNFPSEDPKKTLLDYQGIPDSQALVKPISSN